MKAALALSYTIQSLRTTKSHAAPASTADDRPTCSEPGPGHLHVNLDLLLRGSRCKSRFHSLDAAWKGCMASGECIGVVHDGGMQCGDEEMRHFELRTGRPSSSNAARPTAWRTASR